MVDFGAQYPACTYPLLTLRNPPCGWPRIARGRHGSLLLCRTTLAFATPRRLSRRFPLPGPYPQRSLVGAILKPMPRRDPHANQIASLRVSPWLWFGDSSPACVSPLATWTSNGGGAAVTKREPPAAVGAVKGTRRTQ